MSLPNERDTNGVSISSPYPLLQLTQSQDPVPSKVGEVEKQGSGKGMFASAKWKTKLLVTHAGLAMYFDSTEITGLSLHPVSSPRTRPLAALSHALTLDLVLTTR